MQLARALGRQSELAIRVALGASYRSILLVLAAESVVLAVVGTTLGVALTYATNSVSAWLGMPTLAIDVRVLAFAVMAGVTAALAFGVLPAWMAARGASTDGLKESSRGLTPGARPQRLKSGLVVAQIALAFVLLSAAASFGLGVRE